MRIAVFGAGGVGGYFGGRLARVSETNSDLEVVFIARGEHLRAMRSNGLRVESILGDFTIQRVRAYEDPAQAGVVDAVLLAVKAWQTPEAAEAMRPMIGSQTFVVPLMNGVDAPAQLASVLGKDHVLGGLCRISSFIAAPGVIRHVGIEPTIAFGELEHRSGSRPERLRDAFIEAGVRAEIPPDVRVAMWEKFIFIAAISGVGAATRAPAGIIRSLPETRQMLEDALKEVAAVARAQGVRLGEDVVQKTLGIIDGLPAHTVASMHRDILEGKPSELGAQNGAVSRMGLETGVPTPVHTFIYQSLLPVELRARGEIEF